MTAPKPKTLTVDSLLFDLEWEATFEKMTTKKRREFKAALSKLVEEVIGGVATLKHDPPHHKNKYLQKACIVHEFVNYRCTQCGGIQASYRPQVDTTNTIKNNLRLEQIARARKAGFSV